MSLVTKFVTASLIFLVSLIFRPGISLAATNSLAQSNATVDVINSISEAKGHLRFSETTMKDAEIIFTPVEISQKTSNNPLIQMEHQIGQSKITLLDTREVNQMTEEYVLMAAIVDGKYTEYGMLSGGMRITLDPQSQDASIMGLTKINLSEEPLVLGTIAYKEGGNTMKDISLQPLLTISNPLDLGLKAGAKVTYGSQISWTLTPKIN